MGDPGIDQHALAPGQFEIGFDHLLDELIERSLGPPTERVKGVLRVAQQVLDIGDANGARVDSIHCAQSRSSRAPVSRLAFASGVFPA